MQLIAVARIEDSAGWQPQEADVTTHGFAAFLLEHLAGADAEAAGLEDGTGEGLLPAVPQPPGELDLCSPSTRERMSPCQVALMQALAGTSVSGTVPSRQEPPDSGREVSVQIVAGPSSPQAPDVLMVATGTSLDRPEVGGERPLDVAVSWPGPPMQALIGAGPGASLPDSAMVEVRPLAQVDKGTTPEGEGDDKSPAIDNESSGPPVGPANLRGFATVHSDEEAKPAIGDTPSLSRMERQPSEELRAEHTVPVNDSRGEGVEDRVRMDGAVAQAQGERPENRTIMEPAKAVESLQRRVLSQAARAVHAARQGGRETLVVRLDPPDLGSISLRLISTEAGLTARFVASEAATRALLAESLSALTESLTQQGLTMEGASVFSGDASDSSSQQGRYHGPSLVEPMPESPEPGEELVGISRVALDLQV